MSVDYYSCERCGDTFPDCGDYTTCNEDAGGCGRTWCDDGCAEADGYIREYCKLEKEVDNGYCEGDCEFSIKDTYGHASCDKCKNYIGASCSYCRNEAFEDSELLEYALLKLDISKEDLIQDLITDKNGGVE